ncbi:MAG: HIT domain-containing protein [Kiritimatiellae bacterium]|nr:HIT domain-containing protein [Kiritimatiellia bacterium]
MSSIFTKIIHGEMPCHKLIEDDQFFSFLDIRPINPGHALVIPKKATDYFFDLEDDLLAGIMGFAKPIAKAIEKVVPCERVGLMVAGLEVPHAHIHLVPFRSISELSFAHTKPAKNEDLASLAEQIRTYLL